MRSQLFEDIAEKYPDTKGVVNDVERVSRPDFNSLVISLSDRELYFQRLEECWYLSANAFLSKTETQFSLGVIEVMMEQERERYWKVLDFENLPNWVNAALKTGTFKSVLAYPQDDGLYNVKYLRSRYKGILFNFNGGKGQFVNKDAYLYRNHDNEIEALTAEEARERISDLK